MSKQGSNFPPRVGAVLHDDAFHLESLLLCCGSTVQCPLLQVDLLLELHEVAGMSPLPPCRPGLQPMCPALAGRPEMKAPSLTPCPAGLPCSSCHDDNPNAPLCAISAAALSASCRSAPPGEPEMGQHNSIVATQQQPLHQACPADCNSRLRGGPACSKHSTRKARSQPAEALTSCPAPESWQLPSL